MGKTRSSRVTSRVLCMQQGESLDVRLMRGDSVSVLRGRVRLAGPAQWMGESLVQTVIEVREGEQHFSAERGERAFLALSACELCVVSAHAPFGQLLRDFWTRLSARSGTARMAWGVLRRPAARSVRL